MFIEATQLPSLAETFDLLSGIREDFEPSCITSNCSCLLSAAFQLCIRLLPSTGTTDRLLKLSLPSSLLSWVSRQARNQHRRLKVSVEVEATRDKRGSRRTSRSRPTRSCEGRKSFTQRFIDPTCPSADANRVQAVRRCSCMPVSAGGGQEKRVGDCPTSRRIAGEKRAGARR